MADTFHPRRGLQGQVGRARLNFIRLDLELLVTYATIAETQHNVGNRKVAARILAKAEKSYAALLPLFSEAKGLNGVTAELEEQYQSKLNYIRERLDGLQQLK